MFAGVALVTTGASKEVKRRYVVPTMSDIVTVARSLNGRPTVAVMHDTVVFDVQDAVSHCPTSAGTAALGVKL